MGTRVPDGGGAVASATPSPAVGSAPAEPTLRAPDPGTVALELQGVVKRYGKSEAVRGVDLKLNEGELLTLLGPSGSGKTTLLKLVAGFVDMTEGKILLRGQDVSALSPAEREIGMVFQNYALFPHMTVDDNVGYPLKIRKWEKGARARRVEEMLQLVGLPGFGGRLPRELSGGQQQRVALARALAFGPSLLLMDEPLGALDRELRERMMVELRRIHEEVRVTALYVTHDREEALTLADRVGIMRDGHLKGAGTATELLAVPPSSFIASFFSGHTLVPATLLAAPEPGSGSTRVLCLGQALTLAAPRTALGLSDEVSVAIPPSAISGGPPPGGAALALQARVVDALDLGDRVRVTCLVSTPEQGEGVVLRINGDRLGDLAHQLSVGRDVRLYADASKLVVVGEEGER